MIVAVANPYWGADFGHFFLILLQRLFGWCRGGGDRLASDEVQLLVLLGVALACSLVGTFLVLRRMAMLANSLSHTVLLGIVIAQSICLHLFRTSIDDRASLSLLLLASLIAATLTVLCTRLAIQVGRIPEDASIGLVFTALFAIGLVLLTLFTRNIHIGTEVIMGNIDALHSHDIGVAWITALVDAVAIGVLYPYLQATSFDRGFSRTIGLPCRCVEYLLLFLTALTAIAAFRAVGVLLVLAYLTGPILAARLLCWRLRSMVFTAIGLSVFCAVVSVAFARHCLSAYNIPFSTAGLSVCIIGLCFAFVCALTFVRRRVTV